MKPDHVIYMDHSATTPTNPEVLAAMQEWFTIQFGNPSSLYSLAKGPVDAINTAREEVAKAIGAESNEIYFTSGGTESDNWALIGTALANQKKGNHIITSVIEHHAILHTCKYLEKLGFEITYLPVDNGGLINPEDVRKAITDKTVLVSIMFANNEIGTIQPIAKIGAICREKKVTFHTDAVQAAGNVPIDVKTQNIDLLSLSSHKFYGPKGTGVLFIRKGIKIDNYLHGGAQEKKRRAGTENVPGIVGTGKALTLAVSTLKARSAKTSAMRDRLLAGILDGIPNTRLNGDKEHRLPGNINVSFEFIEGESLLLHLNHARICASTGSACSSGSLEPSHVLMAIGVPIEVSHGSLRLTLGSDNTDEEVDYVLDKLKETVKKLRNMSPLYADYIRGKQNVQ